MGVVSLPTYQTTFAAVDALLQQCIGHRLFTVSRVLVDEDCSERIYSSSPKAYPVSGKTPRDRTAWTVSMERGELFIANRPEDFGPHFSNLSALIQQGFGAVLNIPVLKHKRLIGNLNLLGVEGAYTGPVLDACREAALLAAPGFSQYEQWLTQRSA